LLALALAALFARMEGQAQSTDALPYSKGYLVTGNYVVGGVDVIANNATNGFVTGNITIGGVPDNAHIVAAYLYWETIWTNKNQLKGVTFRGEPVTGVKEAQAALTTS